MNWGLAMKRNLPVTRVERPFTEGIIVTRTDLKGVITHANDRFVEVSGFSREELVGSSHNIVRHPDMAPVLFEDMWRVLQDGRPWRGVVKNRCKNGDYYWVNAFVVPVRKNETITGYMSVRHPATREEIRKAESDYEQLANAKGAVLTKQKGMSERAMRLVVAAVLVCALVPVLLFGGLVDSAAACFSLMVTFWWQATEHKLHRRTMRLVHACNQIAEGRLNNELSTCARGALGAVETALAGMQVHIKVVVDDLQMASRTLSAGSEGLLDALNGIYQRMENSTRSLTDMSATTEELSASIESVASHATETAAITSESCAVIEAGAEEMSRARSQGEDATQAIGRAEETILSLSEAIAGISSVTKTIHEIADQTNLLALNAAIEAARAGETGRGFAVVADEVRKLAERTSRSTEEIYRLVGNVRNAANGTVETMRAVTDATQTVAESHTAAGDRLAAIQVSGTRIHDMMTEIANTNGQQSMAAADLSGRMSIVAEQVTSVHESLAEANAVVRRFTRQASAMAELAGHFEVEATS